MSPGFRQRALIWAGVALLAAVAPGAGQPRLADPDPADTGAVAVARWKGFPLLPDGRFPIGAWCAPPARETKEARYAEFARAGLNVTMGMLEDPYLPAPSIRRLVVSRRHRVFAFVRDGRVHPDRASRPGWQADVDSLVRAYSSYPALLGYFLADEPQPDLFPSLGALNRRLARRDPRHPGYVNLLGFGGPDVHYRNLCYTEYLRRYLREARPAFFSFDHYPLLEGSDSPYFLPGLDSTALVSREMGVPFWAVLQLTPHLRFRKLTDAELAWQANLALAHGARGIVWFTYWSPNPAESFHYRGGPISYDGRRNSSYDQMARLNPRIQDLGRELSRLRPLGVRHVGSLPRGCAAFLDRAELRVHATTPLALGFFAAANGRLHVLIVNRDYQRPSVVRLTTRHAVGSWRYGSSFYSALRIGAPIPVGPGQAELLRLPTDIHSLD